MRRKFNSIKKLNLLTQSIEQHQLEQINSTPLENKRIMLVEDEDDIALLFKMILESDAGLKVEAFTKPLTALDKFRSGLYDLIIIDIAMPEMNGIELYYKIRELDGKIKVCFVTASDMYYEEFRKEISPELDTNCYIRKPISNQDLIQRIKDILSNSIQDAGRDQ
jgi:two-component system response regulator ChvI